MKKFFWTVMIMILFFQALLAKEWCVSQKIVATDRHSSDYYGWDISISDKVAIIGAPNNDYDASGSNIMSNAGSAYICRFDGSIWHQEQKLVASDRKYSSNFGYSVDIEDDIAVVSAPKENGDANNDSLLVSAGAVYVYRYNGSVWVEEQKIVANDREAGDRFGHSVAISGDVIIIGAYDEDEDANNDNTLSSSGSSYVFRYNGSAWVQEQKLVLDIRTENKHFGVSVDILGNTALIGSYSIAWESETDIVFDTPGEAYVFAYNDTSWVQTQELHAINGKIGDNFGHTVRISNEFLFIGAPHMAAYSETGSSIYGAGAVCIFEHNGHSWEETQKLFAPDADALDAFGDHIAASDSILLIGAPGEDHNIYDSSPLNDCGSAYFHTYTDTGWSYQQKVTSPIRQAYDVFGQGVGVFKDLALISSYRDDEDENEENTIDNSGSVYFYNFMEKPVTFPDICIRANDIEIMNGDSTPALIDHTDFGTTYIDSDLVINTFEILNLGQGTLDIDSIYVNDIQDEVFSLLSLTSNTLEPDSSAEFTIAFEPVDTILRMAAIHIASNDPDENPYVFSIQGKGKNKEVEDKIVAVSDEFFLAPAYPNPFNPKLILTMINASEAQAVINIYNCRGEWVDQVINEYVRSGEHRYIWDASNMPSGIYFISMSAGNYRTTQKAVLLK